MGRVWRAEQEDPRREVALKVLRAAAPPEYEYRFRREVELLASLEHPGLARVYTAGTSEDGQPWLAMELVRGQNILAYAMPRPLQERLRLLEDVCRAVHYAHSRGVIHRDLKPSNIFVDERGQPRVLDFGVAHVAQEDVTAMTVDGQLLGTIAYMSPEQLSGQLPMVDPRTDVYALGVIAYQLISGQMPHHGLEERSTLISALRIVTTEPPRRLSRVAPGVRGDLETIVMKALEPDPERRYASALELATDLDRFLRLQPIEARPPTLAYTLRLFLRRHQAASAAALLGLIGLVTATAISAGFAIQANHRLQEREAVNGFLIDMLTAADPEHALGEHLTVRDVLELARTQLATGAKLPTSAVIQLKRTLGNTYSSIGEAERGVKLLDEAVTLAEQNPSEISGDDLQLMRLDLSTAMVEAGMEAPAERLVDRLVAQSDPRRDRRFTIMLRMQQATIVDLRGNYQEALHQLQALLPEATAAFGTDDKLTLEITSKLAANLTRQGRYEDALELATSLEQVMSSELGANHPRTLAVREIIASSERDLAHYDDALKTWKDLIKRYEEVLGSEHIRTWVARVGYAATLAMSGHAVDAAPLAREAHQAIVARLGANSELARSVASLRAYTVSQAGDRDEAIRIYQEQVDHARAKDGGPEQIDLPDFNNLGNLLLESGREQAAVDIFRELMDLGKKLIGVDHLHYAIFRSNYAACLLALHEPDQAQRQLDIAVPQLVAALGPEHPSTQRALHRMREVIELGHNPGRLSDFDSEYPLVASTSGDD